MAHSDLDKFYREAMCVRPEELGEQVAMRDLIQELIAEHGGYTNLWYERIDRMINLGLLRWAKIPTTGWPAVPSYQVAFSRWEVEHIAKELKFKTWGLRGILNEIERVRRSDHAHAQTCAHCGQPVISERPSTFCSKICARAERLGVEPEDVPELSPTEAGALLGVSKQAVQYAIRGGRLPTILTLVSVHAYAGSFGRNAKQGEWHPERAPERLRDKAAALGVPPATSPREPYQEPKRKVATAPDGAPLETGDRVVTVDKRGRITVTQRLV
jgi:hypothetical protein